MSSPTPKPVPPAACPTPTPVHKGLPVRSGSSGQTTECGLRSTPAGSRWPGVSSLGFPLQGQNSTPLAPLPPPPVPAPCTAYFIMVSGPSESTE